VESNVCMFTRLLMPRLRCLAPQPEVHSLASRALLAAQVPFVILPDELLGGILRRAWADRPSRPAAEEVRAAAGLASVCRRVRELLRAAPLPLALDFSAARLSVAQESWLLGPAQAGRVEAAKFQVVREASEDALWERTRLDVFLARHGGTLLQLSGVPLHLVACASHMARTALDLSGLRLTKLGIKCCGEGSLIGKGREQCLWPEYLPSALEELALLGLAVLWDLAWAPRSGAGVAGWLPRLHTLCFRADDIVYETDDQAQRALRVCYCQALLEGFASLAHLEVDSSGAPIDDLDAAVFDKVRSARIVSGSHVFLWVNELDAAMVAERLCHARLQAAELCAAHDGIHTICTGPGVTYSSDEEERRTRGERRTRELVLEMINRCGDRFAVEVGIPEVPPEGRGWVEARLNRLAWRRWPAPGAPDLPAARAAHERARAWAAAGGAPCVWR